MRHDAGDPSIIGIVDLSLGYGQPSGTTAYNLEWQQPSIVVIVAKLPLISRMADGSVVGDDAASSQLDAQKFDVSTGKATLDRAVLFCLG
ncbi:hypothetical protein A6U86_26915 [Rhizobium sp. AC27/96]|nr:hypothetical protein A6U86_26915 [Rhizobium sp. AC27/96]